MPIYEYECEACGNRFELIQKFSDPLVEICPKCGERKVHKLLSSPAFQFKGTGWYVTDYARKGTGESSEKKADGKSSSDTSNSDKSGSPASSSGSSSASSDSSTTSSASGSSGSSGTSTTSSTDKASTTTPSTKNS